MAPLLNFTPWRRVQVHSVIRVRLAGFGQTGDNLRAADLEAEQGFVDLQAGPQSLTIGLVAAPQADRLAALHPDELAGVGGHLPEILVGLEAELNVSNTGLEGIGGRAMRHGDHGHVLFDQRVDLS